MTEPLTLLASSGNDQIDQITAGLIAIFETHFPNRIRGYYFQGSCADQATTSLSDIDSTALQLIASRKIAGFYRSLCNALPAVNVSRWLTYHTSNDLPAL